MSINAGICKSCGNIVAFNAKKCPKCGDTDPLNKNKIVSSYKRIRFKEESRNLFLNVIIYGLLMLLILLLLYYLFKGHWVYAIILYIFSMILFSIGNNQKKIFGDPFEMEKFNFCKLLKESLEGFIKVNHKELDEKYHRRNNYFGVFTEYWNLLYKEQSPIMWAFNWCEDMGDFIIHRMKWKKIEE